MLIEDDVYSELYFGREKPLPPKPGIAATGSCTVLHSRSVCSGLSHWLVGCRQARPHYSALQLMSTLSTSSPMQLALVDYCLPVAMTSILDACAVSLLSETTGLAIAAASPACRREDPSNNSGYFLWLELPESMDAGELPRRRWRTKSVLLPGKCFPPRHLETLFPLQHRLAVGGK